MNNVHRLEWAIKTHQPWPLIQKIEGVTYEDYRRLKLRLREERRRATGGPRESLER